MSGAITVVIPVYGLGPHLEEVVGALAAQLDEASRIVISHSGEGDPAPRFAGKPQITVIHSEERLFAGAARNRGMALADTDWVAFVDEDVVPAPGWHAALTRAIERDEADCIVGAIDYRVSGGYWGIALWYVEFGSVHPYLPRRTVNGGASANMAVRREQFMAVGGFPEDWRFGQDTIAQARLAAAGRSILFDPKMIVHHFNRGGIHHMWRHLVDHGHYSARVRREYSSLPGASAVKWPMLSLAMLPARLAQTARRAMTSRSSSKGKFLLHLPGITIGLTGWSIGFAREAFRPNSKM